MTGGEAGITNEDSDGLSVMKSSATSPTYGANRIKAFTTHSGNQWGGCSEREEEELGMNDNSPRDFVDVNYNGIVNAADTGLVRAAFNAVSGTSALYKRTLDLNPPSASGGRGNGVVNAADTGIVRASFNRTCPAEP
jgi:hypothetical protein